MIPHPVTVYWHRADQLCFVALTPDWVPGKQQPLLLFCYLVWHGWTVIEWQGLSCLFNTISWSWLVMLTFSYSHSPLYTTYRSHFGAPWQRCHSTRPSSIHSHWRSRTQALRSWSPHLPLAWGSPPLCLPPWVRADLGSPSHWHTAGTCSPLKHRDIQ